MERARHQLLAGATLAQDEDGGVGGRDPVDHPQHLLHRRAGRDDAAIDGVGPELSAERHVLADEPALLGGLPDEDVQLLDPRRLGEVVVGAQLHGFHGGGNLLEARHDDDLGGLGVLPERPQDPDAFDARHLHVQQQDVGDLLREPIERRLAIRHAVRGVSLPRELAHQQLAQVLLVVGDEHTDLCGHAAPSSPEVMGRITRNAAPPPAREATSMRPP